MDFEELEHFSLRWNNYNDTMKTGFHDLLQREDFVDVTIAADGKVVQAHKMVLSICSPYFKTIFKNNPCQHPVVFLKDVTHRELSGILQFMYLGEVSIKQEDLGGFLRTAEALQVKGLTNEDTDDTLYENGNGDKNKANEDDKSKIKLLPMDHDDDDDNGNAISIGAGTNDNSVDDDYEPEGVLHKKMKIRPTTPPVSIDPHVPVITTPERATANSHIQPPEIFVKNEPSELDFYIAECEGTADTEENDDSGDYQSPSCREDFAEEIMDSFTIRNNSEIVQDTDHVQSINEMCTPGETQQGTAFPTRLRKNQGLCPICGRVLQYKKNLQTHILDQHSGIFGCWPCQICHRVCRTWSALRVHTNRHHLNLPPAAVQMSIIGIPQQSH